MRRKVKFPLHLERDAEKMYADLIRMIYRKLKPIILSRYKNLGMKTDGVESDPLGELWNEIDAVAYSDQSRQKLERMHKTMRRWTSGQIVLALAMLKDASAEERKSVVEKAIDDPDVLRSSANYVKQEQSLMAQAGKEFVHDIQEVSHNAFMSGESVQSLALKIDERAEVGISKAEFWARDQVGDVYAAYTETMHDKAGIESYKWVTAGDSRVRGSNPKDQTDHRQLNGRIFSWKYGAAHVPNAFSKPGAKHAGQDYNCILGNENVLFDSNVIRCFRRWFTGKLTTIVFEPNISVSTTGNHPILTTRGWIKANRIKSGDYVIKIIDERIKFCKSNIDNGIFTAEQIFNSALLAFPFERIAGLTSQFHGDGIVDNKVDIIRIYGNLTIKRISSFYKFISKFIFTISYKKWIFNFISCFRKFSKCIYRFFPSFIALMSFFSKSKSFFSCHFGHSDKICLTPTSDSNVVINKSISDDVSGDSIFNTTGKFAQTTGIILNNGELVEGYEIARVLNVVHSDYSGYVYNFETESNIYYVNNLSTHNCRCVSYPSLEEPELP